MTSHRWTHDGIDSICLNCGVSVRDNKTGPYCQANKPLRVEIWRYTDNTLTFARSDGACWNSPDTTFGKHHEGVWDSMYGGFFVPDNRFSDGTPVSLYEGLEPAYNLSYIPNYGYVRMYEDY